MTFNQLLSQMMLGHVTMLFWSCDSNAVTSSISSSQDADLTAEEHLFFYARLKGVKWSREKAVVERALRQVRGQLVRTQSLVPLLSTGQLYASWILSNTLNINHD